MMMIMILKFSTLVSTLFTLHIYSLACKLAHSFSFTCIMTILILSWTNLNIVVQIELLVSWVDSINSFFWTREFKKIEKGKFFLLNFAFNFVLSLLLNVYITLLGNFEFWVEWLTLFRNFKCASEDGIGSYLQCIHDAEELLLLA